ncbi:MAG: Peptidase M24 [Candidatus Gottesmanbacteria bacterium GW2011_GWA1_43_11]|uniref:Peptidase M24 n=1 Tax=Candidatus Gottesmanbacteria bacterium GW2011_GWA1_43_11 TaxID=1618436 RepID=A0A0G1CHQ9_9BACT|nr:MAG: Peptidase M24 [Candidatus Gottesmanbacteria bacterium GW2011_GWA1_43_11]
MTTSLENDALLVSNPVNIRYLTGFWGANPEEREAYVLLLPNYVYLLTNALYLEQAKALTQRHPDPPVGGKGSSASASLDASHNKLKLQLRVVQISREKPLTAALKELLDASVKSLGFEEADLTVAELRKLEKELPQLKLIPMRSKIETRRMFKRPDELKNMRAAAKLTDQCFASIIGKIKSGISETELAWEIESFFRKQGATSAFSPIVAFGKNSSLPHYSGSDLENVEGLTLSDTYLILLDFGARVNGYCADMTRVVFFGKPTNEQKQVYQTVLQAQFKALVLLETGERSGQILDQEVRNIIAQANLPTYPHSLGHSLGLAIHETPRLSIKQEVQLKPGMVLTIEPGVYLEHKFGIRIEDLVYINGENKLEILSQTPKELLSL